MAVFVLDKRKKPLMPCSEKRARLLLERGKAVVHQMEPFTIRLKERTLEESELQDVRLKIDPGSKTTGIAVTRDEKDVVILGEIIHKTTIKSDLKSRRDSRRSRRTRKTRYRKCRFENRAAKIRDCKICGKHTPKRRKKNGTAAGGRESLCTPCRSKTAKPERVLERTKKLPPSLQARANQTLCAIKKIQNSLPISHISFEFAKFDTQLMVNPDIESVEYQQGTLKGYTVREYLLEKWGRTCCYCEKDDVPLEIEHVQPRSKGGSDRIDNLAIACRTCNEEKGNMLLDEWEKKLSKKKTKRVKTVLRNIPRVKRQLNVSLKDAAMMNATRWTILDALKKLNLPLETGTGAQTKMQRLAKDLPKEHYYDALCVGASTPEHFRFRTTYVSVWKANARGNRQMARVDKYGFPRNHLDEHKYDKNGKRKGHRERKKTYAGFQTGDIAIADVTSGTKKGLYKGRIAIRHNGNFNIRDIYTGEIIQGLSHRYFELIQRNDGWEYSKKNVS